MNQRYLQSDVKEDLGHKMVFIGGPRQVGKTTFAQSFQTRGEGGRSKGYLTWDSLKDREALLTGEIPSSEPVIILDEIHKFAEWRGLVKGFYDKHKDHLSILITGSAKLDAYRKGGDSLQGRYHYYRLHPFSVNELDNTHREGALETLLKFGGFPEPALTGTEKFHRRWLREMSSRITHEDVRDLERVVEVTKLDLLLSHLPGCVGSPLSINSLRKLLEVSHESVSRWLTIFENLYVCFRVPPYGGEHIRAVKKEQKLYFRDWSRVKDPGARFENLVACQLLKYCDFIEDTQGFDMELRYVRDTDGREVDFVVLRDGFPEFAVEAKTSDRSAGSGLRYFIDRTTIPEFYQVHLGKKDHGNAKSDVRILPFTRFCEEKQLP